MTFIVILIGLLVGVLFYSSTTASYKKAGAGQTYRIESSTSVKLSRRLDNRSGARSRVDRGFYSKSISASGRAEAYQMSQSMTHTFQQTEHNIASAAKPGAALHSQSRPPRPTVGSINRPGSSRPKGR